MHAEPYGRKAPMAVRAVFPKVPLKYFGINILGSLPKTK